MAKRAKAIQDLVDNANKVLALREIVILRNGALITVAAESSEGQAFKDGMCECLHLALHASKSYKGYMYLELDENNNASDKFMRKYF
jgi:hypothetical protein